MLLEDCFDTDENSFFVLEIGIDWVPDGIEALELFETEEFEETAFIDTRKSLPFQNFPFCSKLHWTVWPTSTDC
jgi:hypothetical protein